MKFVLRTQKALFGSYLIKVHLGLNTTKCIPEINNKSLKINSSIQMQQGQKSRSLMERLPAVWQTISKDYEFLKIQGQGSFG